MHARPSLRRRRVVEGRGPAEAALDRFVELIGAFWNENGFGVPGGNAGTLESTRVVVKDGVTYYEYETVKPHNLISAAVTDGQLYVINASARKREAVAAGRSQSEGHRRVLLRAPVNTRRHHESAWSSESA